MSQVSSNNVIEVAPSPKEAVTSQADTTYQRYQWSSRVLTGWQYLEDGDVDGFPLAMIHFRKAIQSASSSPTDPLLLARAHLGLALIRYESEGLKEPAPTSTCDQCFDGYRSILSDVQSALNCFKTQGTLPIQEYWFRGLAHRIAGQVYLLLADGTNTETSLRQAELDFQRVLNSPQQGPRDDEVQESLAQVLYTRGSLACCRADSKSAQELFLRASQKAVEFKTRIHSFLDYTNTLLARNQFRLAKAQETRWNRLQEDARREAWDIPLKTKYWATLLFARINLRLGYIDEASTYLDDACRQYQLLSCQGNFTRIEQNAYWVIRSEYSIVISDFEQARLANAHLITDHVDSNYGYRLLRLLALDTGCQMCVVESTCQCQKVTCTVCTGRCHHCEVWQQTICFVQTEQKRKAFDVEAFFVAENKRLHGMLLQARGDYESASQNLAESLACLDQCLGTDTPARLETLRSLIDTCLLKHRDSVLETRLKESLQSALRHYGSGAINAELPKDHVLWSSLYEWSGISHLLKSEFDLALCDFKNSMQSTAAQFHHGSQRLLVQSLYSIDALLGSCHLDEAEKQIAFGLQQYEANKHCDRKLCLQFNERCAMTTILRRRFQQGRRQLERLYVQWQELREHATYSDGLRKDTALWMAVCSAETQSTDIDAEYSMFASLATTSGLGNLEMARYVNRTAIVLQNYQLFDSADYLYRRAAELFSLEHRPDSATTVLRNLDEMNRARNRNESGVPLGP